jgi:hypothetical protein
LIDLAKILRGRLGPEPTFNPEQKLLCAVLGRALADALGGTAEPHERRLARCWLEAWDARKGRYPVSIQELLRYVIDDAEGCHLHIMKILHGEDYDATALLASYGYTIRRRNKKNGTCDGKVS